MANITYINPKGVKEIVVHLERESSIYPWYGRESAKKKTILWGLVTIGRTPAMREGWGYERLSDGRLLKNWSSLKIDRSGLEPKLISKASVTIYFGYNHYSTFYYDTNEESIKSAEDISEKGECIIKIAR